jgi:hypothetical protein
MKTFDQMSLPDLLLTKKAYEDLSEKNHLILKECEKHIDDVGAGEICKRITRLAELIDALDERILTFN